MRGFPVCGFVPVSDSPNFRAVPRDPDFPDIDGLDHVTHNSRMAARVAEDFSAGRSPHAQVLWDGSVGEVAKGYSQGPFSFAAVNKRFGAGNWRAMHAFAVEQVKPDGPRLSRDLYAPRYTRGKRRYVLCPTVPGGFQSIR